MCSAPFYRYATGVSTCSFGSARATRSRGRGHSRVGRSSSTSRSSSRSAATSRPRSTCKSCRTWSSSRRAVTRSETRSAGSSRRRTSGWSRATRTPRCRPTPSGIRSTSFRRSRSTTSPSCSPPVSGCGPSSPTRTSASRWRPRRSPSPSYVTSTWPHSVTMSLRPTCAASCCDEGCCRPPAFSAILALKAGGLQPSFALVRELWRSPISFAVLRPPRR